MAITVRRLEPEELEELERLAELASEGVLPVGGGHVTVQFMQGNRACALGAMAAGCRFYAGYPITPSSEIAEILSRELPKVGGKFIQMEDEIASMAAIIGASIGGLKAMTATSGPGFSLMQENIGYRDRHRDPVRRRQRHAHRPEHRSAHRPGAGRRDAGAVGHARRPSRSLPWRPARSASASI